MNATQETSSDPAVHCSHLRDQLTDLIEHLRKDIDRVPEPRFQALSETSAEVLSGLRTAYEHYLSHNEVAWPR